MAMNPAWNPAWADEPVEDGVYLGMKPKAYFGQNARGSSEWIRIHFARYGWWWGSPFNPDRVDKKTKEMTYGSGLHSILLEGMAAYERSFAAEPDPKLIPGLVTTVPEIKKALTDAGFSLKGMSAHSKEMWAAEILHALPDVPCWSNIKMLFDAQRGEREVVSALDDRMLRLMRAIAIDPNRTDNAAVRRLLVETEDHPALAEVSIFKTVDGIRRRWRIDRMYPGLDMDLKSLGNWRGRPLPYEVGQVLAQSGWDIQRADYFHGRTWAYELIREGKLFGGSLEQRRYIERIVDENPTWDWIWLVYQKPDPKGRAPVIFPLWDDAWGAPLDDGTVPPSPLRAYGQNKLDKAIAFYREAVDRFGLETPWASVEELHYTEASEPKHVKLPHWIQDDEPVAAAAYASSDATEEEEEFA